MALESKDRDRLEKLLNMLGSPNDGEIGNAGRMIQKMAERYNVTPAVLCLGNPQQSQSGGQSGHGGSRYEEARRNGFRDPFAEQPKQDYARGGDPTNGYGFRTRDFNGGRTWYEREEQRQREEQAEERQRQREARNSRFHEEREAELRAEGARRAREQAKKDERKRRHFPGNYFGLLSRLKAIYDNQFEGLENWQLDFIETVLESCKADRMMTTRQRDMAKALIKHNEQAEPLV